jgi:cobalt-precorrin 5A hydrolase/precorrin-3B C17-methyltransferase
VIGLVAATAAGRTAAAELAHRWPDARRYDEPVAAAVRRAWAECDQIVCFLAVGATVRLLAPLLDAKDRDPGVVCVDEARRFAVPVVGGHAGGANALAIRVAAALGAEPVLTTASDAAGVPALDTLGADLGFRIERGSDLAAVGAALLSGEPVGLSGDATWPLPPLPPNVTAGPGAPLLAITDGLADLPRPAVIYRPPSLVVGIGASRGAPAAEVLDLIDAALAGTELSPLSVRHLATVEAKADEPGIRQAAGDRGWPVVTHPAAALATIAVPHPSEIVRSAVGTPSVAEAAALAGDDRAELLVPKRASAHATVAIARHRPRGRLTIVGLGPGARDLLTPRAAEAITRASVVVGLDQYVDQVRDLIRPGARVLASSLGAEEERAATAVAEAQAGHAVALLGSGDAGVYAMASPALAAAGPDIDVVGVPGITAALAAAALLGAPLGHDHAAISLSDLHTPWEVIERRLRAAADGDFVVTLYNPRSRGRDWQLDKALGILAAARPPGTPVGVVREATRPDEQVTLTTLAELDPTTVDMRSLVVVGSSTTQLIAGRMVTPRGYRWQP